MPSIEPSCSHISSILVLDDELKAFVTTKYTSVISWYASRTQNVRPTKRRKIAAPTCTTCDLSLSRPFACLQCNYVGCWSDNHVIRHLNDQGHYFCKFLRVDAKSGCVYCTECGDFIYDSMVEEMRLAAVVKAEEKRTRFQDPRENYKAWKPDAKDTAALETVEPIPCQGRRGLLNLGQTCFLNAVLQCLIHNPLLRNYFLSDKHNYKQCKTENCTCCEMDKLFTEVYSEDTGPYGPITLLATTWKASAELAGYAQQDAHEFFISALNQIHQTSRGCTNVSCNCIIHSTFAGQLQSDVKCERCGNITSTIDPMLDISLELKSRTGEAPSSENTLGACLRRFTQPEKLGSKEYSCAKCGKAHEASKRLSIRKLPPVLSFQFKRFEQKTNDKSSARKIDTPVRFPASINMAPYTSLFVRDTEKDSASSVLSNLGSDWMYEYDLFAVINHEGQMNNGHYTNFARFQDEWYRFDDDKVTHSSLGVCLSSVAYMCFYVKRHLDYRPHIIPAYILAQKNEAARERVLEKEKEREKEKEKEKEKEALRMKEIDDDLLAMV
ncbi:cysteine proteinase [Panaeolus papilionaceus]|nr:cysteine proteinase [Panaeolus papilionaceus]